MPSLLFVSIVAGVEEVEIGRWHVLKIDFRQFQELEAQNDGSRATAHMQRRFTEAGMVVACHLGGLLDVEVGLHALGWKMGS